MTTIYEMLPAILAARVAPVVLEIGAHVGEDTRRILDLLPASARYFAFEPDARNLPALRAIADPRLEVLDKAVGRAAGRMTLYLSGGDPTGGAGDWSYSSSIKRPTGHLVRHPWCRFDRTAVVEVVALDGWRPSTVQRVDFVWMDAQGAEADIIAGGSDTLTRTRWLYTEATGLSDYEGEAAPEELLALLPGWELTHRFPYDMLLRNTALACG